MEEDNRRRGPWVSSVPTTLARRNVPHESGQVGCSSCPTLGFLQAFHQRCTTAKISCADWKIDTTVAVGSTTAFPPNDAACNVTYTAGVKGTSLGCTTCNTKAFSADAWCFDCADLRCRSCAMAHHFMRPFEAPRVLAPREQQIVRGGLQTLQGNSTDCLNHHSATLRYFCHSCDWPAVCEECALLDHPRAMHNLVLLSQPTTHQAEKLRNLIAGAVLDPMNRRSTPLQSDNHRSPLGSHSCRLNLLSRRPSSYKLRRPFFTIPDEKGLGAPQNPPTFPPHSAQSEDPSRYQTTIGASKQCPKDEVERKKMTYYCRLGMFGSMNDPFPEPSGMAQATQDNIIVADSNNHRMQIFDQQVRFKRQFGKYVKRAGQM
ncbi:hypothetical protein HPB48_009019 [Haemaphysalis longicornis]|uniref:B box-type domain-containing protein n=1 Tax=Haemaphysalis longicornis TaxID=44386 RepID=A0A9J6H317_HAELO|nr:hypothetical protein HPB48_009019 [Haemaphysalis longicornis]